ncbi:MAG: TIGR00725 family protein [Deltaproteobacteria bacterium]|nr:TIGR00725 family protein [Deltaproteobacteria bacterium]MBI3077423.1 TIGR00725 family protein [Deltaproteobacteria bacterium]
MAVCGPSECGPETARIAEEVGREIARHGAILLCGGLGGIMEAAARGARAEGGLTVGILPGSSAADANPFIDLPIVTGLSHARNLVLVRSADAVIAVEGGYGTLIEVASALKMEVPVIGLRTWEVSPLIVRAATPAEAVKLALERAR